MKLLNVITSITQILAHSHGDLQNLGADDHAQYLNTARHDLVARHGAGVTGLKVILKTADQIVNNSTVLVNDNHFLLSVAANENWVAELFVHVIGSGTAQWKYTFTVPAGGACRIYDEGDAAILATASTMADFRAATVTKNLTPNNTVGKVSKLTVHYVGGGTAGTLQLQWAQAAAEASDMTLKASSHMVCHKLGT